MTKWKSQIMRETKFDKITAISSYFNFSWSHLNSPYQPFLIILIGLQQLSAIFIFFSPKSSSSPFSFPSIYLPSIFKFTPPQLPLDWHQTLYI